MKQCELALANWLSSLPQANCSSSRLVLQLVHWSSRRSQLGDNAFDELLYLLLLAKCIQALADRGFVF